MDEVVEGAETFILPVQTQHYTNVGEIVRNFTRPMHLVLLGDVRTCFYFRILLSFSYLPFNSYYDQNFLFTGKYNNKFKNTK